MAFPSCVFAENGSLCCDRYFEASALADDLGLALSGPALNAALPKLDPQRTGEIRFADFEEWYVRAVALLEHQSSQTDRCLSLVCWVQVEGCFGAERWAGWGWAFWWGHAGRLAGRRRWLEEQSGLGHRACTCRGRLCGIEVHNH